MLYDSEDNVGVFSDQLGSFSVETVCPLQAPLVRDGQLAMPNLPADSKATVPGSQ